jgi:hypothetical protein
VNHYTDKYNLGVNFSTSIALSFTFDLYRLGFYPLSAMHCIIQIEDRKSIYIIARNSIIPR